MAIFYPDILDQKTAPRTFTYGDKDVMLYALGVGMGQDPMNETELPFVYEKGLKVIPTAATVLAAGARSAGGPAPEMPAGHRPSQINFLMVVHGEQKVELHKPLTAGGTYTAHAVSLAAAAECLRILDETPALETIARYGETLKAGISAILNRRGIAHSYAGHPSMFGLFFAERAPDNYRDWKTSDYSFYDQMAHYLHDLGVICEPDSREPWFVCEAHGTDSHCLADTLTAVETAVDLTLEHGEADRRA